MPWKVVTYIKVDPDEPEVYNTKADADSVANHLMYLQSGDVITTVVECDTTGEEI